VVWRAVHEAEEEGDDVDVEVRPGRSRCRGMIAHNHTRQLLGDISTKSHTCTRFLDDQIAGTS
jgi:hypothetical protein